MAAPADVLADLAEVVSEEISDCHDGVLTGKAARYVAACVLVGMANRGWQWRRPHEITVTVDGPSPFAATVEQVQAFIEAHSPFQGQV